MRASPAWIDPLLRSTSWKNIWHPGAWPASSGTMAMIGQSMATAHDTAVTDSAALLDGKRCDGLLWGRPLTAHRLYRVSSCHQCWWSAVQMTNLHLLFWQVTTWVFQTSRRLSRKAGTSSSNQQSLRDNSGNADRTPFTAIGIRGHNLF